jgi:ABC-2 type transport system permease protein
MTDKKKDPLNRFLFLFRILVPLIALLLVVLQWWQNSALLEEAQSANRKMQSLWVDQPPAFPLDKISSAVYLPSAVSPLAAFDAGEGPWLGQSIWMQLSKIPRSQDQIGYDVFPAGRQIGLNAAMFAQIIIPCLALILGWAQVRQSRSISLQSWASLQTSIVEFAGPTVAVCCLLTAGLQSQILGGEGAIRLMLILGAYMLYAVATGTICWLVFQCSSGISQATALLAVFWLFNFSLARPISINVAAAFYPLPTLDAYARKLDFEAQNGYNGVDPKADRQRRFVQEALRDNNVFSPRDLKINLSALVQQKEELHYREVGHRLRAELEAVFLRQERFERAVSLIFPYVAIQIASSSLAATDFASERRQLSEAEAFWDRLTKQIFDDVVAASGPEGIKVARGKNFWSNLPLTEFKIPSPVFALETCLIPSIGLGLICFCGIAVASRAQQLQLSNDPEEEIVQ